MFPLAMVAGREVDVLVIDLDATIVIAHSEKEHEAPTFEKAFGHHSMLAFCDSIGEFLVAQLRRGQRRREHRRRPHHRSRRRARTGS
ncbi:MULTISPECIES: transposase [unclassified Pseudonocardia]|uniref:transposase n=1 Tax=unclassified Pseudonocardia TaxID=2619320 RepID=UPI001D051458|nr:MULTISPECIES: transposase [unclassified Pseudonocardia]